MLIMTVIFKNRITDGNAFVTNIRLGIIGGRGDQLPNDILAFVAEGTTQSIIRASALHWDLLTEPRKSKCLQFIIAKLGGGRCRKRWRRVEFESCWGILRSGGVL